MNSTTLEERTYVAECSDDVLWVVEGMTKTPWIATALGNNNSYAIGFIQEQNFTCGYCGRDIGTKIGIQTQDTVQRIYICPMCNRATYFESGHVFCPLPRPGETLVYLPDNIRPVYEEIRSAMQAGAFTSAVLLARTLLSHIAVTEGAPENKPFNFYVEWLDQNNHIPPKGKHWVSVIKNKGNDAAHDLEMIDSKTANLVLVFVAHLLRNIYEMSGMLPVPPVTP